MKFRFLGLFIVFFANASAEQDDSLPKRLSGHWMYSTFVNSVTLDFDGDGRTGPITGKMNWRGVTCGAENEPFAGTWDGHELRIEAILRANVNANRMNGQCGDGKVTVVLVRNPGERTFEGEARATYTQAAPKVSVAP